MRTMPGRFQVTRCRTSYFLEGSFLKPAVNSGQDAELLGRIFQFFEHIAASSDIEVVNLLNVGLFEAWVADAMTL